MEARFGTAELAQFDAAVDAALADAAAEIDASLSALYDLPLGAGPWPLLRRLQCDLARAGLYGNSVPEAVAARAAAARDMLAGLRDGKTDVVGAERRAAVLRAGPDPVMTAGNLAGF